MRFNPAISLICAFIFTLGASFSNFNIYFLLPIIFLVAVNFSNSLEVLKKLLFLNLFIFTIFIFVWFQADFYEAINIYLRTNIIIFFNLLLFFDSKGLDIIRGFFLLKFPKRFISAFYFTWKMIIELQNEFRNIKISLVSRNFSNKTSLFTYQTYGNILGLLFIKSMQKAQNLKDSFDLRGFNGEIYLNSDFSLSKYDYVLLFITIFTLILKVFL
ncbi:energy-coupling factor transporter transmembrane component T family protein [Aliarcobacter butzleri]|uniref:Energy-coupling factor transporter transmembrane component T n=1 Tax=Aliarcobacter butzleri TaxID=28197 RepID=A0AAP4UPS8_9BACT|nr:energy-coupling factor transporter transmembrane component T [Aliarcobacter butzleri]MCG3676426.1 energy-coupling factor transporter transmembrane protein EcfT [Aliarcobacter butzleri]MCG3703122.1 energy-coupling factor transporter transmembrane protein EcfT [Aliarcobacter butzleri]MCG3709994.1 energy-coupling factor transporter transmembrane protein EcfT [Aliarcobacter butzleri]MCT7576218.1 energy-coupling factor transporter transmembrane protein EcfT [Aliarcobacter butzleri]MCT7580600.1 e